MVLEARYKAEKVEYPIIGEKTKDGADVVDYNINEEITIDYNSAINANNGTTTGMSTLVYGVNAPKILEDTSIYNNTIAKTGKVSLTFTNNLDRPSDNIKRCRTATIVNDYGNLIFKNRTGNSITDGVVFPLSGWYQLEITYARGGSTRRVRTEVYTAMGYTNDELLAAYTANYNSTKVVDTIIHYFDEGTAIYVWNEYRRNDSGTGEVPFDTYITITKL